MAKPGVDWYFCLPPVLLKETKSRFILDTACLLVAQLLFFGQLSFPGYQLYSCGHTLYTALAWLGKIVEYKVIRQLVEQWETQTWNNTACRQRRFCLRCPLDDDGLTRWSLPKLRWYRKDVALDSVSPGTRHFLMGGRDPLCGSTRNPQSTQYFTFVSINDGKCGWVQMANIRHCRFLPSRMASFQVLSSFWSWKLLEVVHLLNGFREYFTSQNLEHIPVENNWTVKVNHLKKVFRHV